MNHTQPLQRAQKVAKQIAVSLVICGCLTVYQLSAQENTNARQSLEFNERGALAVKQKNFQLAEEYFRKAVSIDPTNITGVYNLSAMYLTNKKLPDAVALLSEYSKKVPNDPGLWKQLGDAHFAAKELLKAQTAYEKSYALDKNFPDLTARLGAVYTLNKKLPEAESMLYQAALLDKDNADILANLAAIYHANGKYDEAIGAAKRALAVKTQGKVYVTLGAAYEAKKDHKNALIAYQRAFDLGDKSPALKEKIDTLQKAAAL